MKDNDPLKSASKIKAIFHDIEATGIKIDLQLTTFIKVLHPVYSNYLEFLNINGTIWVVAVANVFSWDILLLPKIIDCMMRRKRSSFFLAMLFSLNQIKVIPLLVRNWIIWRNLHLLCI